MIRAALLLLILFATQAMAAPPPPKDFAWKISLNLPPGGTLYELTVPVAVYRGTVSPDLADICIFNGRNEIVPFSLTTPPPQTVKKLVLLPHFPLPERPLPGEKLSIRVERRTTGEIVTVAQNRTTAKPAAAYLLDTTSLTEPIESLELEWSDIAGGFVERVSVEGSDDLEHWRHLTTATLAALQRGGNKVEQRQIQLSGLKMRYLRIVQLDTGSIINVTKVIATLTAGTAEPAHQRMEIAVTTMPGKPGEFTFDLGGQMPLDRIRLLLPERNSLVKVAYFSRSRESDPWVQRIEGISYRLDSQAGELSSPELTLPANQDRYWKLKIAEAGGGTGTGSVKVEVAWRPQKILFLPRGDAPFTLAFGSGRVDTRSMRGADLLSTLPSTDPATVKIVQAEAGEAITLAGKAALKPELSPVTKKKLLLWGLLLLGVGLLVWMALRLGKQMKREEG